MTIVAGGKTYRTMKEAAPEFGVSAKQVYEWIKAGLIPEPPFVWKGRKTVMVFPPDYMVRAQRALRDSGKG